MLCSYLSSLCRHNNGGRYQDLIACITRAVEKDNDDELRHDVDVLRGYFAIRQALELVLNAKTYFRNNDKQDLHPEDMLTHEGEERWSAAKENIEKMFKVFFLVLHITRHILF